MPWIGLKGGPKHAKHYAAVAAADAAQTSSETLFALALSLVFGANANAYELGYMYEAPHTMPCLSHLVTHPQFIIFKIFKFFGNKRKMVLI